VLLGLECLGLWRGGRGMVRGGEKEDGRMGRCEGVIREIDYGT